MEEKTKTSVRPGPRFRRISSAGNSARPRYGKFMRGGGGGVEGVKRGEQGKKGRKWSKLKKSRHE